MTMMIICANVARKVVNGNEFGKGCRVRSPNVDGVIFVPVERKSGEEFGIVLKFEELIAVVGECVFLLLLGG